MTLVWVFNSVLTTVVVNGSDESCAADGGSETCESPSSDSPSSSESSKRQTPSQCQSAPTHCIHTDSMYESGTAQAYKPSAPLDPFICDPHHYDAHYRYKAASWPLSRSSYKKPPRLTLTLLLQSCSTSSTDENSQCCCQPLASADSSWSRMVKNKLLKESTTTSTTTNSSYAQVEVWQTRPDGSYSSLRPGIDQGDCRTRVVFPTPQQQQQAIVLETVLPGSTGILGGLGPSQWDFPPFGPPVIHILATAQGHAPSLIDLPILVSYSKTSITRKDSFWWSDWRGSAWIRDSSSSASRYDIVSWEASADDDSVPHVHMAVQVFLPQSIESSEQDMMAAFCPSKLYGPSSFFLQPISVCAPSMLDFFAM